MKKPEYNVVVIGAGTAGLVTAAGTAGLGGRVALIERNRMGGDCLNFGCVPSKALIASARMLHAMRNSREYGFDPPTVSVDFDGVFESMRNRRALLAPNDSQERFESLGVDVFRGEARFVSPHEVSVDGKTLSGAHLVIATGTRASKPPIEGIEEVPFFTNETIFDELKSKPQTMLIIGGGPIGCELAQAFARLDVEVTIVQKPDRLLPREDPDVSTFMRKVFEAERISVMTRSEVQRVAKIDGQIRATIRRQEVNEEHLFDAILIAAGRTPNTERLNVEAAGIRLNKGRVAVNEYLQTSQPHIYAAGDVTGGLLFTHIADYQARAVVRNILMPLQLLRQKVDHSVVPWCTYTDPEVARVGLNETDACERGIEVDIFRQDFAEVDRAVLERAASGFAKILTRRGSDKILGATVVAAHAGDLIPEIVLAMKHGIGLGKIGATIHSYPTFGEYARKTADKYSRTRLTPRAKQIFKWLYHRQRQRG